MTRSCKNCYFFDNCGTTRACADFAPIHEEITERDIEKMIEREREEFFERFLEQLYEEDRMQDYFG